MVFSVPAVAPSAPLIQKHQENPGPGAANVPWKSATLMPAPTEARKLWMAEPVAEVTVTPAKFVPLLSK